MKDLLDFFIEVGKLKRMPRRGWIINQIKNPESIAEHIFRSALMGWIIGEMKGNINVEKLIKIALIHDLCEVYAGDTTPYDSILPRNKKKLRELMKTWPRFSTSEKKKKISEKFRREKISSKTYFQITAQTQKRNNKALVRLRKRINPRRKIFPPGRSYGKFFTSLRILEKI